MTGREARLIELRGWEIARLVGEASIIKPLITVYEGITEEVAFLVKLQEKDIITSLKMSSLLLTILLKR